MTSKFKQKFLAQHPVCAFCGGATPATTIEHCPPQSFFQGRIAPEGFVFPACVECNNGSSTYDLLFAMLARLRPEDNSINDDGRHVLLMRGVTVQFPSLVHRIFPSALEARRLNRSLGLRPEAGQTHQDIAPIQITSEMHEAVESVARKLAKALYYTEVNRIFPPNGELLLHWFTNAELYKNGHVKALDALNGIVGTFKTIERNNRRLDDQFGCKVSISEDLSCFLVTALFGESLGMVIFGSTTPGFLSGFLTQLEQSHPTGGGIRLL